ncbi:hypothetical protein GALMADRAFT_407342 [Galerina marginata CBS 339.88]|uniref:Uncharacterized protein n=1 Tax=Galerina marginata (strain CBS 339.88) TaxID=685588 RepID=A0A067T2Z7_GALM3|nr:hypothetical protein GALMADRAFT_407342 [Galerina marginata CBS 339.88]
MRVPVAGGTFQPCCPEVSVCAYPASSIQPRTQNCLSEHTNEDLEEVAFAASVLRLLPYDLEFHHLEPTLRRPVIRHLGTRTLEALPHSMALLPSTSPPRITSHSSWLSSTSTYPILVKLQSNSRQSKLTSQPVLFLRPSIRRGRIEGGLEELEPQV